MEKERYIQFTEEEIEQTTDALYKSKYGVYAKGNRNVRYDELQSIVRIILNFDPDCITEKLETLYLYNPETIELDRQWQEENCQRYNAAKCNCFYPDNECWFKVSNQNFRNSQEYAVWRKAVYERDNYTCQQCGQVGGELSAHHVKSYSEYEELRTELTNGITLCVKCHKKRHKKGA